MTIKNLAEESRFTKEQLIARALENLRALECFPLQAVPQMDLALMKIAIAVLTAKPLGWTDAQELLSIEIDGCGYLFKANPVSPNADSRRVIKLYRLPEIE
ncbi:hypothetical protein RIL74_16740 [Enterobacter ludwigii]|uniref:hypothetical protein n=1 Tax=Enterobacter ludwigii TaxID=299767 RepID=UPI00288C41FC|nr:hypothetical protein [Enterobacter ludwigii]WNI52948.1 hypothetical protein RIL74_16740 [Enterobacter ludwigii]